MSSSTGPTVCTCPFASSPRCDAAYYLMGRYPGEFVCVPDPDGEPSLTEMVLQNTVLLLSVRSSRGSLVVHVFAVAVGAHVLVLAGRSGSGKLTLAALPGAGGTSRLAPERVCGSAAILELASQAPIAVWQGRDQQRSLLDRIVNLAQVVPTRVFHGVWAPPVVPMDLHEPVGTVRLLPPSDP